MQLGPFVLCPPLRSEDKLSSHFLLLHHRCWPSFNSANEAVQRHLSLPPDNSTLRFLAFLSSDDLLRCTDASDHTQEITKNCDNKGVIWGFAELVLRKAGDNEWLGGHLPSPAAQPVVQSERGASPHTPAPCNTRHGSLSHTRGSQSPFCSSQSDILTRCLSVFDNALAPGR